MDAKLKSGVLAVGIVVGLVVVVGAVVAIAGGKDRRQHVQVGGMTFTVPDKDEQKKIVRDRENELVAEIAKHPWWKQRPTEKRVRELVEEMTQLQANDVLELTPSGGSTRHPLEKDNTPQGRQAIIDAAGWPVQAPGNTYVFLDGRRTSRRLTRLDAAQRLKSELDHDDFRARK